MVKKFFAQAMGGEV